MLPAAWDGEEGHKGSQTDSGLSQQIRYVQVIVYVPWTISRYLNAAVSGTRRYNVRLHKLTIVRNYSVSVY